MIDNYEKPEISKIGSIEEVTETGPSKRGEGCENAAVSRPCHVPGNAG
jgi:hypothetical protein